MAIEGDPSGELPIAGGRQAARSSAVEAEAAIKQYAITITLKDYWIKDKDVSQAFFILKNKIIRILRRCSKCFTIVAELSPLTSRLHFHGTLTIDDFVKWHKSSLNALRRLGHICVKKIKSMVKLMDWTEYITKDIPITEAVFDNQKIYFTEEDNVHRVKIKPESEVLVHDIAKWFQ